MQQLAAAHISEADAECLDAGGHRGTRYSHKRWRDAAGRAGYPTATARSPVKSTAEIMGSVGLTQAAVDASFLRCGVGGLAPTTQAVKTMLSDMVRRFSHIVPVQLMRACFEELVDTADQMLSGFERGVRLGAKFCASAVSSLSRLQGMY